MHWAQPSGPGDPEVLAARPLDVDPALVRRLGRMAVRLDRLLRRLGDALLEGARDLDGHPRPGFPLAAEFLAAGPLSAPFFWGRFDVFERADGGLAALEYNCDKPAGQREIWAGADFEPSPANPNRAARASFRRALRAAWRRHAGAAAAPPRLAVLADPSHRQEFHLAYLFGREAEALGWSWTVVGKDNLRATPDAAVAYGRPIDVVLRQYPAEFLHELPDMVALWELARRGRLLWLNDPRVVVTQSKSTFALLWQLATEGRWLDAADAAFVRRHVPPTGLAADEGWLARAAARPEDWVIKPVLGRYSEGVTLGALASRAEWRRALAAAEVRPHDHVIQAYVPPRRQWLPSATGACGGHVNWGVYLADGAFAGLCPRLQRSPLTEEATGWFAPLRARAPRVIAPRLLRPRLPGGGAEGAPPGPGVAWTAISDRASLAGYTNVWTNGLANFSLAAVGITDAAWDELREATAILGRATVRILRHLDDPALLAPLGIPPAVASLAVASARQSPRNFVSRMDWARTRDGRWQLLEINSDTPAGLWEADLVADAVVALQPHAHAPVTSFGAALAGAWRAAVAHERGPAAVETPLVVGLAGTLGCPEDHDQIRSHERAARTALPHARTLTGEIAQLDAHGGRVRLRGIALDVLFRYYPLDWMARPEFQSLLGVVAAGEVTMLPPAHALITQSKAFLALLHALVRQGFFPPHEAAAVRAHVPLTALEPLPLGRRPFVAKPYLEREGHGVRFSRDLDAAGRRRLAREDVVYQREVEPARLAVPVGTMAGWRAERRVLVVGVFLTGETVSGVYTRAGARITGREAVFLPLLTIA